MWIPVVHNWRLNERHYGALQGLNKSKMDRKHGEDQVHLWRRGSDIRPPSLRCDDPRYAGGDPRYAECAAGEIPLVESLVDTVNRFLPFWHEKMTVDIAAGKNLLIVAHGNSLRALI